MTDTTPNIDLDDDTDRTPKTLLVDLAHIHLRCIAPPLPKHPGAMGWQAMSSSLTVLAARLLHVVQEVAPEKAAEIADWYAGPFGDGPDGMESTEWFAEAVAGPAGADFEEWIQDARARAERSAQTMEASA
jgi:hypothetical protein